MELTKNNIKDFLTGRLSNGVYVSRLITTNFYNYLEKPELTDKDFKTLVSFMTTNGVLVKDENGNYSTTVDIEPGPGGEELYDFDLAGSSSKTSSGTGTLKVIAHNEEHAGRIYANMLILEYIPIVGGNLTDRTIYCREPIGIETPMDFYFDVSTQVVKNTDGTITLYPHTPKPKSKHTITASTGRNGSISPSGEVDVNDGDDITFTFIPDKGYEVDSITIDGANPISYSQNTYTFTNITEDHRIHVEFKPISTGKHTITASAGENGSISPSGEVEVDDGDDITFTFIPDEGYLAGSLNIDGTHTQTIKNNQYTFTKVTKDHTITVTFKQKAS